MKSLEEFVFDILEEKKSEHLFYHDKEHTQEVLAAALHIAHKEGISEDEILLLKTAALLHDVGYVFTPANHEEKSCEIAKEILPKYNFTPPQIERICRMIMATKIPQKPLDHLSQILCDADLSYFGTNSYKEHSERLFKEFKSFNNELTRDKWLHQQIHFLSSHHFFTASASKEFNQKRNAI
jgi:HD superfamily phosphodiesterase